MVDAMTDSATDEGGRVIPFPRGGRDGIHRADGRWDFRTEVRWVEGAEGEWLRHELADVLRDVLVWARNDLADALPDDRQERRAA